MKEDTASKEKLGKKSNRSLHDLILTRDTKRTGEFCQKLRTSDIDILDSYDESGMTPLHIAISKQDVDLVALLLEYGADPNKRDSKGNTPIVRAVEQNNPKIVLALLEEGADLKKTDSEQQAILKIANTMNADKCIDVLRDYGAFFISSKKAQPKESSFSGIESFIKEISSLIFETVDQKKSTVSFDFFYSVIVEHTKLLFGITKLKMDSVKPEINKVFDQILVMSTNKIFEHIDTLNAVRRIINTLSKVNISIGSNRDKDLPLVLSKLENTIEDRIVHCRTLQLTKGNVSNKNVITKQASVAKKSVVDKTTIKKFEKSELVKIETSQIIIRNVGHEIDLINFVNIVPHHIQQKSEIECLLSLSEQRKKFQNSILGQDSSLFKDEQVVLKSILSGKECAISMNDASTVDKILRVGKDEHVHILSLSLGAYESLEGDLRKQAIELGATVHTIQYPKKTGHKFDLVYAGIAAVNKLLDDNIHPDKIFIQCDSESYKIVKIVVSQFAKRGVALSEIIVAASSFDAQSVENNHRCLLIHPQTYKAKPSTKYDRAFNGFFKHLVKCFKGSIVQRLQLSTEISKNYTVIQLISLFIKCNQLFLKENVKSRNPNLPNDKVDNIIGVHPDEV